MDGSLGDGERVLFYICRQYALHHSTDRHPTVSITRFLHRSCMQTSQQFQQAGTTAWRSGQMALCGLWVGTSMVSSGTERQPAAMF